MKIKLAVLLLAGPLLLCPLAAGAQQPPGTQAAAEQGYEAKLRRWEAMSEPQRQKLRERARALSPEKLGELKKRRAELRALPGPEQKRIRENYGRFERLSDGERETLKSRHSRFRALPESRREELRGRAREKRRAGAEPDQTKELRSGRRGAEPLTKPSTEDAGQPPRTPEGRADRPAENGDAARPELREHRREQRLGEENRRKERTERRDRAREKREGSGGSRGGRRR